MNNSRGLGRLIAITCALAVVCALVFGTSFLAVRAQASNDVIETTQESEWFVLTDNDTKLVVRLANYNEGYTWKYGQSYDILDERHGFQMTDDETKEDNRDEFTVHFQAADIRPAVTTLIFSYMKNRDSEAIDTKMLKVRVSEDGTLSVE